MERLDHTNLDFERLSELCSPFIQDLVVFVVTNMHDELEAFLKAHCRAVDDNEELHKHRYWDMFQDYSALLESKLSLFVEKHDMTAHTFYAALQEAQTQDQMAATIIQYLLGATEYRRFVDLLIDRKLFHYGPGSEAQLAGEAVNNGNDGGGGKEGDAGASKSSVSDDAGGGAADFSRKVSEPDLAAASGRQDGGAGSKEGGAAGSPSSRK